jgi:hypothetical protein
MRIHRFAKLHENECVYMDWCDFTRRALVVKWQWHTSTYLVIPPIIATMPQCFLCSKEIAPAIARFQNKLQPIILHTLRANFPTWSESATICPECVQQVLTHAKNEEKKRGIASLQYDLGLPFPVRSRTQAYILPTPYRTQADQRFSGRGVTIAFLDSGFSPHPDLAVPENRIRCYADATGARVVVRRSCGAP